jgi:hypothetical protein
MTPPPPNFMLEAATLPPAKNDDVERRWQRRFGVTYGVWGSSDAVWGTGILAKIADPALDHVFASFPNLRRSGLGPWTLVRVPNAFPSAWVARRVRKAPTWGLLFAALSTNDVPDEAWFLPEDHPPLFPDLSAQVASVQSWDGHTAIVKHDGSCILILRRTYYPGWVFRVSDGPERPVLKVNGGLQGIPLIGSATNHVEVRYRPTRLALSATVSLVALVATLLVFGVVGWTASRGCTSAGVRRAPP